MINSGVSIEGFVVEVDVDVTVTLPSAMCLEGRVYCVTLLYRSFTCAVRASIAVFNKNIFHRHIFYIIFVTENYAVLSKVYSFCNSYVVVNRIEITKNLISDE